MAGDRLLLWGKRTLDARRARSAPRHLVANHRPVAVDALPDSRDYLGRLERIRSDIIPWLEEVQPLRGAKILEIGSGAGPSTLAMAEQGASVTGVDANAAAIATAEVILSAAGVDARMFACNAAELDSDVVGTEFDHVVYWACLEHMTVPERLGSLRWAWAHLRAGGLLTTIETPNRLWWSDSHTSRLPFFNWLPDEVAFAYSRFSDRPGFAEVYREQTAEAMLGFRRRGRGVSYHEYELAIGPLHQLEVVACMQTDRRRASPVRAAGWRLSDGGRYERTLGRAHPGLPEAFRQPFLYFSLRKP